MKTSSILAIAFLSAFSVNHSLAENDASSRENPSSSIPYESGAEVVAAHEERWSDFLPIFGKEAREQGYVLPRPFGISLGYMGQEQPFDVGALSVNGIDIKDPGFAEIDEVDNREDTFTLRLDAWIFPFLNVYGILGKTDGRAQGPITLNPEVLFGAVGCRLLGIDCEPINTRFKLDYEGDVHGGGITIAGGYQDFFGMVDSNYTETDLDISKSDAEAWVTSARIGWNGKLGSFAGALWLGAMYQDIDQTLDIEIPAGNSRVLRVNIQQSVQEPWSYLIGGRWELGRGFEVLAEFGFAERRSNMLNLTYRF